MSSLGGNILLLVLTFLVVFGATLLGRRLLGQKETHAGSWAATLGYVTTAYGVIVGFSILFLFGQYANAKAAVGDEATSIGTAFDQATLFPESQSEIQRALVCYARAVSTEDWPAMAKHEGGSPKVDAAYFDLVVSVGVGDEPAAGALHAATATNLVAQIGSISTSREARLVTAETRMPPMLWILLLGGGALVVVLLFVVTLPARKATQATLVSLSAVFTMVMLLVVFALNGPFAPGNGRVSPRLIDETTVSMTNNAPAELTAPCS